MFERGDFTEGPDDHQHANSHISQMQEQVVDNGAKAAIGESGKETDYANHNEQEPQQEKQGQRGIEQLAPQMVGVGPWSRATRVTVTTLTADPTSNNGPSTKRPPSP